MGNLSRDLLALLAHPLYSTDYIRDRVVYIEPANQEVITPFNPLLYHDEGNRYYNVVRAIELILRGFKAQDIKSQPRLYRWLFNAITSASQIGIPIAMCRYLMNAQSPEQAAILARLPPELRSEWSAVLKSGRASLDLLDSTRNRFQPFFKSPSLRRMFGCWQSRFDVESFIRERKIVILNLAELGSLAPPDGATIGALAINEIFKTAYRMATLEGEAAVRPTYVMIDEFQRFVGPDMADTIPTARQMGLRCILAHQSFAQLELADCNLQEMIWQARTRLVYANDGRDADIVAEALAKRTYDPFAIKDERYTLRQMIVGFEKEWMENYSESHGESLVNSTMQSSSNSMSDGRNDQFDAEGLPRGSIWSQNSAYSNASANGQAVGRTSNKSRGASLTNVPIHRNFRELASRTYKTLDEQIAERCKEILNLDTGFAFLQRRSCADIPLVNLSYIPIEIDAAQQRAIDELKARSRESRYFISASEADEEAEKIRIELLTAPRISISTPEHQVTIETTPDALPETTDDESPFSM